MTMMSAKGHPSSERKMERGCSLTSESATKNEVFVGFFSAPDGERDEVHR